MDQRDLGSRTFFQAMAAVTTATSDWDDGDDDVVGTATIKPLPGSKRKTRRRSLRIVLWRKKHHLNDSSKIFFFLSHRDTRGGE